jgi:hypothetical protein
MVSGLLRESAWRPRNMTITITTTMASPMSVAIAAILIERIPEPRARMDVMKAICFQSGRRF